MSLRTQITLLTLVSYATIPNGLSTMLREDGYPWWVRIATWVIFAAPAVLLAGWFIERATPDA